MKRRLVKLGQHTLMAAIPAKWLKQHDLQKGDSVHFGEVDNLLILSSGPGVDRSCEVLLEGDTWNTLRRLYTKGYDEIQISFKDNRLLEIESCVHALHNMEITQTGKQFTIIKATDKPQRKDFDATLRRTFTLLKNITSAMSAAFSDRSRLDEVRTLEYTLNKNTLYLKRIINRSRFEYSHPMYVLIHHMEKAANQLEYLRQFLEHREQIIGKDAKQEFTKTQMLTLHLPLLFYSFNEEEYHSLSANQPTFESINDAQLRVHLTVLHHHLFEMLQQVPEVHA